VKENKSKIKADLKLFHSNIGSNFIQIQLIENRSGFEVLFIKILDEILFK